MFSQYFDTGSFGSGKLEIQLLLSTQMDKYGKSQINSGISVSRFSDIFSCSSLVQARKNEGNSVTWLSERKSFFNLVNFDKDVGKD